MPKPLITPINRKLFLIFVVTLAILIATFVIVRIRSKVNSSLPVPDVLLVDESTSSGIRRNDKGAFNKLATPEGGAPKSLIIHKSGEVLINLSVVMVGKDSQGFMETPQNWNLAGWYNLSSKTAQNGNVILNGHYDDVYGKPAAFFKLKQVVTGDTITIVDEYNRPFDYAVTEVYYLSIDDPDRFKLFEYQQGTQNLTLITCGGVWIPKDGTYDKRLVVRALRVD